MTPDQSMLNEFKAEASEHITNLEKDLLSLENKEKQQDKSYIDNIFRAVHSIKGSSSFLNFNSITDVSHAMETLIQKFRDNRLDINTNHIDALLEGLDLLAKLVNDPLNINNISISSVCEKINHLSSESKALNEINRTTSIKKIQTSSKLNKNDHSKESVSDNRPVDQLTLKDLNRLGFKHDYSEIPNEMHLFIIQFDIFDIEEKNNYPPIQFLHDLNDMGKIVDGKTDLKISSIEEIPNNKSLIFEILYETRLKKEELPLLLNLPESCFFHIKQGESQESTDSVTLQNKKPSLELIEKKPKLVQTESKKKSTLRPDKNHKEKQKTESNLLSSKIQSQGKENVNENENEKDSVNTQTKHQKESEEISVEVQTDSSAVSVKTETIRMGIDIIDKIMNLAGELVLVRNQLMLVVDKHNTRQTNISQRLDMVTSELQEAIMRTRMQPVGNLLSKLPRIVRDLGKKLNKLIVVITKGDDVELDKNILENLSDPLTHIIRNACDHGIEFPEQRIDAGKTEIGYIKVSAYHEAGQINIKIEDDGKGIDLQKVKEIAMEKKLKTKKDIHLMSDKDLIRLIMLPGFSTRNQATKISGRGVGMDVVKNAIEDMSGSIDLHSEKGTGTIINLRLPLTLAIIPSLIVVVNNERLAIPEVNVEELISLYDQDIYTKIETNGDQEVYRLRKYLLPLVRLKEVLSRKGEFNESVRFEIAEKYNKLAQKRLEKNPEKLQEILIFAVLKNGNMRFGLIIDEVIGTEEIVVNPIHSVIKDIKIFSGTTIMGDGTVALILDVNGIVDHCGLVFSNYSENQYSKGILKSQSDTHRILLFKCGQKEQFAMPLLLMKRVEIIEPEKIQEIGDREYVSIDGKTIQIVRLNKILNVSEVTEFKRMFLLIPKQSPKPFGLIVSRLIDVINMPLELNREDCIEDGFLGTALIEEKITLFVDIFKIIEKVFQAGIPEKPMELKSSIQIPKKVLLVEDTVFFRRLIEGQLSSEGFDVSTAENGVKALELLEKEKFDIILSDI